MRNSTIRFLLTCLCLEETETERRLKAVPYINRFKMTGLYYMNREQKTLTKQEIDVKTESSHRVIPIPDYAFEAILEERKKYEKNKKRRSTVFQDLGYVCCSSYGRPRSKNYHFQHYKKLLKDNDLPDIRWHDLRASYCTLLLKNDFNPKAVSKLMGHAKEIVTIDVYGDNKEIIRDCVPEISDFINRVIPKDEDRSDEGSLLEIVPEVERFF